jgi:hypothetical protein
LGWAGRAPRAAQVVQLVIIVAPPSRCFALRSRPGSAHAPGQRVQARRGGRKRDRPFSAVGAAQRLVTAPPAPARNVNNVPHDDPATGGLAARRPAAAPAAAAAGAAPFAARLAAAGSGAAGFAGSAEGRRSNATPRSAPTAGACPGGAAQTA